MRCRRTFPAASDFGLLLWLLLALLLSAELGADVEAAGGLGPFRQASIHMRASLAFSACIRPWLLAISHD